MKRPGLILVKNLILSIAAFLLSFSVPGRPSASPVPLALAFFTFSAYQLAAWYPSMNGFRIRFIRSPSAIQVILTVISAFAGLFLMPFEWMVLLLIPAVLTGLYYTQWSSGFLEKGLRSFFLVKNLLVALIWTFLTTNIGMEAREVDLCFWLARFDLILLITIALDLRDVEADRSFKVQTLPVIFGFQKTRNLIIFLSVVSAMFFLLIPFAGNYASSASILLIAISTALLKPASSYWAYYLMLDGIMVVYALFLLI